MAPRKSGGARSSRAAGEDLEDDKDREGQDPAPEQGADDELEALGEFFEKFGGKGNKIVAERFNEESGDWVNVDRYNFDGFDPFVLRKFAIYPTTRFRLTLRDAAYRYIKGGRYEISFAKPPEEERPAAPVADKREEKTLEMLMQTLRDDKAQLTELLKAQMTRPSEKLDFAGQLELLGKLKDIMGVGAGGAARGESPFKSLKEAMEFMAFMRESMPEREDKGSDSLISQIGEAVKVWKDMQVGTAARHRGALPAPAPKPAPPGAAAPAGGGVAASNVVTNPPNVQEDPPVSSNPIIDAVQGYVPIFVNWAVRGQDVEVAADFLVAELEESLVPLIVANYKPGGLTLSESVVWDQILARAQNPKEVEGIFAVVPQLAPYRLWVEAVVKRAVEIATADSEQQERPS